MVKVIDFAVTDLDVTNSYISAGKCGYRLITLALVCRATFYVKYEIPRWTHTDAFHIKARCDCCSNPYKFLDILRVTDSNPSDKAVIREKTFTAEFTLEFPLGGKDSCFRYGDKSQWINLDVIFYTDSGGNNPVTIRFYWNARSCTVTNITVTGTKKITPKPPTKPPKLKILEVTVRDITTGKTIPINTATTVYKGDKIHFITKVYNEGGDGEGLLILYDSIYNEKPDTKNFYIKEHETREVVLQWVADKDRKMVIYALSKIEGKWTITDWKGCP